MASVEVLIFTFNQENYVAQALNSVIQQETKHQVSIRLHDDASTDGTVKVAEDLLISSGVEYVIQKQNTNRYQTGMAFFYEAISQSNSDYIAILDGDDYWTNKFKLNMQIELLEKNQNAALCHHEYRIMGNPGQSSDKGPEEPVRFRTGAELSQGNFIGASTVVLRLRDLPKNLLPGFNNLKIGDYVIWALATAGKEIISLSDEMSVYRVHDASVHSSLSNELKVLYELEARFYIAQNMDSRIKELWMRGIENFVFYHHPARRELAEALETSNNRAKALEGSLTWKLTAGLRLLASMFKL